MTWPLTVGDSARLLLVTDDPDRSSDIAAELGSRGSVAVVRPADLRDRALDERGADCLVLDRTVEVEPSWSSLLPASALAVVVLLEADDRGDSPVPAWVAEAGFTTATRDPGRVCEVVDTVLSTLTPPEWSTLDALPDTVAVVDARGRILRTNAAWQRFGRENGGDGESMRSVDYLSVTDAADDEHAALASAAIRRVLRRESESEQVEYPCHTPGRRRWFRMTVGAVDDPPGGAVVTHTDVSIYRQQISILERVLRHNLRNELNVIAGYAAELGSRAGTADGAALAGTVEDATRDMLKLCDRVRTARETLGESVGPGDLAPDLREVVDEARRGYPDAVVEATVPEPLRAWGSRVVAVAVDELLRNALRHSDRDAPRVVVRATRAGDDVVVSVLDDGPGIPLPERRTLMGLSEDRPTSHGEGLGSWLVQTLVSTIGGEVTVSDLPDRGSVVTVRVAAATLDY